MYQLVLSGEAYDDLTDIQNYTYTEFGEAQWEAYGNLLDQALLKIINHPYSRHQRTDIPERYRAMNVEQHVIIYRIEEYTIFVIRILYKRMDFTFQFR